MKRWILDVLIGSGWAGVFILIGFLIAFFVTDYRLAHYRLQDQIDQLDNDWGVVCIARGERMECRIQRITDPGV